MENNLIYPLIFYFLHLISNSDLYAFHIFHVSIVLILNLYLSIGLIFYDLYASHQFINISVLLINFILKEISLCFQGIIIIKFRDGKLFCVILLFQEEYNILFFQDLLVLFQNYNYEHDVVEQYYMVKFDQNFFSLAQINQIIYLIDLFYKFSLKYHSNFQNFLLSTSQ